jgi:hypothetical protein
MKKSFPWELLAFAGLGGLVVWWLLLKDQHDPGLSLWAGLGFGYGPAGNLTSMQGSFFCGANQPLGYNALPVINTLGGIQTDQTGAPLIDEQGNAILDYMGTRPIGVPRNAASIGSQFNYGGTKPA